jgi:hypothetical protein
LCALRNAADRLQLEYDHCSLVGVVQQHSFQCLALGQSLQATFNIVEGGREEANLYPFTQWQLQRFADVGQRSYIGYEGKPCK